MLHLTTLALAAFGTGLLLARLMRAAPEPQPAPEEPERSEDFCWTHGKTEPKDER